MSHFFKEIYVEDLMYNLAEGFDYACNDNNIPLQDVLDYFVDSEYSLRIEQGDPYVISGLSGCDLMARILKNHHMALFKPRDSFLSYSEEYWAGFILALYMYETNQRFKDILYYLKAEDFYRLYPALHQESENNAIDVIDKLIDSRRSGTNLQIRRKELGYSQKELALEAGINLRTLQQYENRAKDINKASLETVIKLATVLSCNARDLYEYR